MDIQALQKDLDLARKRLEYYAQQKSQKASPTVDKWLEIYEERAKKIEKTIQKLAKNPKAKLH